MPNKNASPPLVKVVGGLLITVVTSIFTPTPRDKTMVCLWCGQLVSGVASSVTRGLTEHARLAVPAL